MNKEKSLEKVSKGKLSKIREFFLTIFSKFKSKKKKIITNENINLQKQKLEDFEILKNIVEGNLSIKQLDNDTKRRIIDICNNRIVSVNKMISDKNMEIEKMESLLTNIKKIKSNY